MESGKRNFLSIHFSFRGKVWRLTLALEHVNWAVLSDEQMSNQAKVEHQPVNHQSRIYIYIDLHNPVLDGMLKL